MKLVRFKCNQLNCRRDFYIHYEDITELMEQKDVDDLDVYCPFCDDGIGIEIGVVTFDDRSTLDAELIATLVTKSREMIDKIEEITYELENLRVKSNTEEVDE